MKSEGEGNTMKWRLLLVWLLVLPVALLGCGPRPEEEATPTPIPTSVVPDKPTYVVQRGTVENLEQFTARVSPLNEESLFFRKSGYVKVVYVDRLDWVEEGEVLAELELEDLMNQLSLADVDLETAQKRYEAAEEELERNLYSAQMSLDSTNLRLERAKIQAPVADFTSLQLALEHAKTDLEEAELTYTEALDRPWEPQRVRDAMLKNIKRLEDSVTEARVRLDQAVQAHERAKQVYALDIQLLEMDVHKAEQEIAWLERGVDSSLVQALDAAELRRQRLEDQIATGQLVAPFAGQITTLNVTPGKSAEAHNPVAVIADPSEWDITADLTTNQLSLMEEGQGAEITMSSRPGEVFEAILAQLPYPYGTGGGEVNVEDRDERVHIALADPEGVDLEVGDLVKVTVLIERSEDALWLPPAAIRTFEGRQFVMVKEADRLRKVDVKLGIEGEDRVEILTGLEEGQTIEGL
jgi:multidrug efflux pump subunit AcrA (membrane-fusion protein)